MQEAGLFRRQIYEHASAPWEGNSIPLKADLIRLQQNWVDLVDTQGDSHPPCPLTFEEGEAEKLLQASRKQEEVDSQFEIVRNFLGVGSDGWVSTDRYGQVKADSARKKAEALEEAEDDSEREEVEKYWPFDDFDEKE